MTSPIVAPFGTWASPITAARVAAGVRPVASPRLVGDRVLWLQSLPEEGGRIAVATTDAHGRPQIVTPAPFNVRTRVHEYGGGAFAAAGDTIWFSNFADNLVYTQAGDAAPVPLTADGRLRHADLELDVRHDRLVAVREAHGDAGEPRNTIVGIALDGSGDTPLAEGADFYASARVSPEGRRLAWLQWNHPDMPWQGTELWLAAIADDGTLAHARCVAGGRDESLCQPVWAPDGKLHVVSDRSGFWNLYRLEASGLVPVLPMAAEFGLPMWAFAQSSYGFNGPHEIVAACRENAISRLLRIDLRSGIATPVATPFEDIAELCVGPGFAVVEAGSPTQTTCIARIDLADGGAAVLARSADDLPDASLLSVPRAISYPSANGRTAHAFHYPPRNAGVASPDGERPPLIVIIHGGPTSMTTNTLRLSTQFWTSRGFAVLDVNYGGSTGFGRAYRQLLSGQWGIVDVEDCIAVDEPSRRTRALRRRAAGDPRRQCRRLHDAGRARVPRRVQGRRQPLRRRRPARARCRHAQVRVAVHQRPAGAVSRARAAVPGALAHPRRRPPGVPGDLLPGPGRQGGAAGASRGDGGRDARPRHCGGTPELRGRGPRLPPKGDRAACAGGRAVVLRAGVRVRAG
jgi:hypothetical protein